MDKMDIVDWLQKYAQECSRVSDSETQQGILDAVDEIKRLRNSSIDYSSDKSFVVKQTTPSIHFDVNVSDDFIKRFFKLMSDGHIRVIGADGKELKVRVEK